MTLEPPPTQRYSWLLEDESDLTNGYSTWETLLFFEVPRLRGAGDSGDGVMNLPCWKVS